MLRRRSCFGCARYRAAQVAAEFQKVTSEGVSLLEAHEHDVAILVREGENPQIDLLRTGTELANARKDLNVANNAVDLTLSALKNLVGIGLEEPVILTEPFGRSPRPPEDLPTLTRSALSKRPELSALRSRREAVGYAMKAAKGEYLPTVAVGGRYEYLKGDIRDFRADPLDACGHCRDARLELGRDSSEGQKAESQAEQVFIRSGRRKTPSGWSPPGVLELGKAEKNIDASAVG